MKFKFNLESSLGANIWAWIGSIKPSNYHATLYVLHDTVYVSVELYNNDDIAYYILTYRGQS